MDSRKSGWKWLVLAIVVVSILLMSALWILVALHETTISARKSLAPEDLDRVAEMLAAREPPAPHVSAQTEHEADEDSSEEAPARLPTRLERAASPEDLTVRWLERPTSPRPTTTIRVLNSKAVCSVLWAVGAEWAEEEALMLTCKIGRDLMELGEWEEARLQFREVLHEAIETSTQGGYYVRYAAHCLAWLETDPERAAQLLELSCRGSEANWHLADAIDLAEATGSDALADHYRERLHLEHPLIERAYQRKRERRIEDGGRRLWINTIFILPDL